MRVELSMNSANSGNLINNWSMYWGQFKDPLCYPGLPGAVLTSLPHIQGVEDLTTTFYKKYSTNFVDEINDEKLEWFWRKGSALRIWRVMCCTHFPLHILLHISLTCQTIDSAFNAYVKRIQLSGLWYMTGIRLTFKGILSIEYHILKNRTRSMSWSEEFHFGS